MAQLGTRRVRREARREEILDAAMQIVVADGLDALTVARLAKELDAAIGAFYRYFPGKEALLGALQTQALESLFAELERDLAALGEAPLDPDPRVDALVRLLVSLRGPLESAERAPARHRLIDEMLSTPVIVLHDAEASVGLQPILAAVCARFDAAVLAGALAPGDGLVRTHVIWASIHGLDHLRKRDRLQADPALKTRSLATELLRALLCGWGADAELLSAALVRCETLRCRGDANGPPAPSRVIMPPRR